MNPFDNYTIDELASDWLEAKATEKAAIAYRRDVEDELTKRFNLAPDLAGTETRSSDRHFFRIIGRLERKVDAEMVQEIAAEKGVGDWLATLFRWKPEISANAWKTAPSHVTGALSRAITTKASRPSFAIEGKDNG